MSLDRLDRPAAGPHPLSPEELLADLTPAQQRAVTAASATVCVVASAGAGKTRVLTRRIGYRAAAGGADPGHTLAITFTRKAAGEMRERLGALGLARPVMAVTFHALAASQLRRWWADRRTPEPALLDRKGRLISELIAGRPGLQGAGAGELASQLEWAKARLVEPASFAAAAREAHRELPADAEAIASLYSRYEDEKRRRHLVDFDDLLARYTCALEVDSRFAAAQRWRWRHVFVDELQDLNPLQHGLLLAVLGDNDDLFVVGDPNQAIYGWNGSDPGFLAGFADRWPAAEVVRLDDNHRSSPQVVAAATSVLGRQASAVRSSQPDGPPPRLRCYPTEEAEAAGVAAQLVGAHARGLRWAQTAVLVRAHSQAGAVIQALRRAGIPLRAKVTAEVPALKDYEPGDVAVPAPIRAGTMGTGTMGAERAAVTRTRPVSWDGADSAASSDDGSDDGSDDIDGSETDAVTVSTFHRAKGLQWTAVWVCGLESGFVPIAYASTAAALAEERRLLYVALSRAERELHCSWARQRRSSNGALLWREPSPWLGALASFCALPGETRGERPSPDHSEAQDPEEARGGEIRNGARGRRLREQRMPDGHVPDEAMLDFLASARRRLSYHYARKVPAATVGTDPSTVVLAERLTDWRRRLARASGVPAHVLLHDSTIKAIALRKPASEEDLLGVPGLGPVKVARFGPAILEVVQGVCAATG
jgi:DNA helicase II / ATP-dependent DNA helicase PcrA